jgi:hypothetical protein
MRQGLTLTLAVVAGAVLLHEVEGLAASSSVRGTVRA